MELRPGYKTTEVGVIPLDWGVVPFGLLTTVVASGRSGHGTKSGTYPVHGSTGIIGYCETPEYEGNSILAARVGANAGRLNLVSGKYGVTDNTILLRLRDDCSLPFFWRQLDAKKLNRMVFGSGQPLITGSQLKALTVSVPPLAEQHTIAATLADVDALLAGLDRLIAKKRDLKQAAMQQLLTGQTRLPGFQGEWEVRRLGDLGATYGGLTGKSKADFGSGTAKYVTFMNVMTNTVIDDSTFDSVRVSPAENQNRVELGDLLFNGSSETPEEVALCSLVARDVPNLYLNSFCFGFRPREDAQTNGLFLTYYIRSAGGREIMKSLAQGSTRYNLSKKALLAAAVRLPAVAEQDAIATVLSDMDAELTALEARRDKTRALKQGMMQELLTGRTRLV